jgi:uncharacterized protein (TIGR00730 family)
MKTVALFGSARPTPEQAIYQETVEAAKLLAENGWQIATGGGPGLMEAANIGARSGCEGSTCSLGYSIYLPFESETNPAVQVDSHHGNFFTRLKQFTDDCSAFVALPGGYGTQLEILTVVQLLQVGHMEEKPLILVGPMWRKVMGYTAAHLHANDFISEFDKEGLWRYARTPVEAAQMLLR